MDEKLPVSEFAKWDLRVGKVISIEDHPNAEKLYVLKVDLGESEHRTIVAGLKQYYQKEDLEDKKAIFVSNLEPATLRGVQSNGMILAALSEDKSQVVILTVDKDIPVGSKIS